MHLLALSLLTAAVFLAGPAGAQFEIGGDPRVNPEDFTITTYAGGLNFPVGMAELDDGSILTAVANGPTLFGSASGSLLRLVDDDGDAIADRWIRLEEELAVGGPTALDRAGELLFVTGQGQPILILHMGPEPDYEITQVGRIDLNDASLLHPNSALAARQVDGVYELFFPLGSAVNFAKTTQTRPLVSDFGLSADLACDAIHRLTFRFDGGTITEAEVIQIATGLRSASGLAFHPETGDLYFEDNGIDGLQNAIEAHSADEINMIPNDELGGEIEDFGFPDHYIAYRTGEFVGGGAIPPLVAFLPLPDPATGSEAEGPNEIAFAPPGFPPGLNNGLFVGFHGQFFLGGRANEENPLVYVDLETREYFHFISNEEPAVGHLDGLLSSGDRLYVSDIANRGGLGYDDRNSGAIYVIRYTGPDLTAVGELSVSRPEGFSLDRAYPNPFNPSTTIRFSVPEGARQAARLDVHDLTGRRVRRLFDEVVSGGAFAVAWDGRDDGGRPAASGTYVYRLVCGDRFTAAGRVTLLK